MKTSIKLDLDYRVGDIDPRLFSGFLEHLGRAIYGGVYDPENPLSDPEGFRKDVLEALRRLNMPYIRYPGGNFVSNYDWRDGIGPQEERPSHPDFAWQTIEPNKFGTDEFVKWCRKLGIEPMLAVNLGTLGPAEAAALVEYCNLDSGTHWADMRRANGSVTPHAVNLWCLGNEMDGPWQAGHVPAQEYALRAQQAARLMRGIDPSIELVLCGSSGRQMSTYLEWDRTALEYCWEDVDFLSAHRYSRNWEDDSAWFLAEGVEIDRILDDYAGLLSYVRGVKKSDKQVYISFDEWNVWYKNMDRHGEWSVAPHLLEEVYNLEDALVCAQYMNSFIRHADVVKIACLAQIVNVIAPILTRPDDILVQSIYYPFQLYSGHAHGQALVPIVDSPTYLAGARGEVPVLDVSACYDANAETANVFIVNRSLAEDVDVEVSLAGRKVERLIRIDVLTGNDPKACNSWEQKQVIKPDAGNGTLTDDGKVHLAAPSLGLTVASLKLGEQ
jgi:alpha-N-arabinofuranosidase